MWVMISNPDRTFYSRGSSKSIISVLQGWKVGRRGNYVR